MLLVTQIPFAAEPLAPAGGAEPTTSQTTTANRVAEPKDEVASGSADSVLDWLGVDSWAAVPHLGTWGGFLDLGMDQNRQQTQVADSPDFKSQGRLTSQGITIRNRGFSLVNPRLLTGSAAVRFALQQGHQDAGGVQSEQHGTLTGYNFDATLLSEKPYNTTVAVNRSQNLTTQLSGSSTRTDNENRGIIFRWREDSILRDKELLPYFSATVQARKDHTQESTRLADRTFRRDEERDLFGINGHNGTETSDLDFRLERTSLANLVYPSGSYEGRLANLAYSRDFGENRNRRWDSRLDYSSRSGASDMSIFNVDERLTIDHYQNLSSTYNYDFMQQVTESGTASLRSGGVQLQHRLYNNLSSNLGLSAAQQVLPNGSVESKAARAAASYNRAMAWSGRLWASLGGSRQITDSRMQSSQVPVMNSPYQAPAALGAGAGFLLNDAFVVPGSIVVVDVRGGARLPTSVGIDYLVVTEGNRTRILPQPTSVVILPGDPLEVSYIFNLDPSLKFQTTSRSASLGADWRWIGVSVSHDETLQNPLSEGDSRFLTNRRSDTARVELRGTWNELQARGDAILARYNYTQLVYDELRFSQHVLYSPRDNLLLNLSANESHAQYRFPQPRQSEGRTVRLDVDWASRSGWLSTAFVSRRVLHDSQVPTDLVTEAGLRLQRRWAKLSVSGTLGLAERERSGVQTRSVNLHLSAIREF